MTAFHRLLSLIACWPALTTIATLAPAARAAPANDRPLRVIQTTDVRPNFGFHTDVPPHGEVQLAVMVEESGQLRDMLLLGSNHSVFTEAAVQGLQEWRFEPATSNGRPVAVRTVVRLAFQTHGRVISISGADVLSGLTGYVLEGRYQSRLVEADALDRPLRATQTRTPGFPLRLVGTFPPGARTIVTIDFYVDETGRPRMPVVLNPEHPLLSAAALDAFESWQFEPPLHDGAPVIVRARQDFVFFESEPTPLPEDS